MIVPYTSLKESAINGLGAADGSQTHPPPIIDMAQAPGRMTSECVRTMGRANPETTTIEEMNRPRSTGPELDS